MEESPEAKPAPTTCRDPESIALPFSPSADDVWGPQQRPKLIGPIDARMQDVEAILAEKSTPRRERSDALMRKADLLREQQTSWRHQISERSGELARTRSECRNRRAELERSIETLRAKIDKVERALIPLWKEVVEQDPSYGRLDVAWLGWGVTALHTGDHLSAQVQLSAFPNKLPHSRWVPYTYVAFAWMYRDDNPTLAITYLDKADKFPARQNPVVHLRSLALRAYIVRGTPKARKLLKKLAAFSPPKVDAQPFHDYATGILCSK